MPKHTKTPWLPDENNPHTLVAGGKPVAWFESCESHEKDVANAAFAARAVNAHYGLVAALAEIYEWTTHKDTPWAERTRFALAKAVKEPT